MKTKIILLLVTCCLGVLSAFAQPANDACTGAIPVASTSCIAGTTTAAADNWIGSVGCQAGGSHPDVWYTFVATNNQLNINITSSGLGNPVEFILAESPCGSCACSFIIAGSVCGTAPLVDSIIGLNIGSTYYYTISSGGASGAFNSCITNVAAVNVPGQDCPTAANICDEDPFGQTTIASGSGSISGLSSVEDVNTLSCFGSSERQSQWYKFTCSNTGTIEFNINPIVSSDDYDFLLLDITTNGCLLITNPGDVPMATVVACNWSGCKGSTGITSAVGSEPGVITSGAGCFGGPAAWIQTPPTITQCRTYALLIDNFSLSNSGFNFTWGGATGGMTATIGPQPLAAFSTSVSSSCPGTCTVNISGVTNRACYTYNWSWGDGTFSTGATVTSHAYSACGTYIVTLTVTDALGCEASTSQTVVCTTLDDASIPLAGRQVQDHVNLKWEMPSGIQGERFVLKHSTDGIAFNEIHNGNIEPGSGKKEFSFDDVDATEGLNYYRVHVINAAGEAISSEVVKVLFREGMKGIQIAPNPASDFVSIHFDAMGSTVLDVINAQGQLVKSFSFDGLEAGTHSQEVNLSDLARGIYHVKVTSGGMSQTASFLKN